MSGSKSPVEVQSIIVSQVDAFNGSLRIYMNQWAGKCKGSLQSLKIGSTVAPFRRIWLWICFTRNRWEAEMLVNGSNMRKRTFQQVFRTFNVVLPCHSRHRADRKSTTSELQSRPHLVCRLLLEKKKKEKRKIV